jgi:Tfp pilus assembly protein PilO
MRRSQAERLWLIGGGILAAVLVLIGYFFFIGPQRDDTTDMRGQVQQAQAANQQLEAKLRQLQTEDKDLARYQAVAATARRALPQTSELSTFLRSLQGIGSATRTNVSSLTAGTPVDVTTAAAGIATTPAGATTPTTAAPTNVAPTNVAAANAAIVSGTGTAAPAAAATSGPRVYALPINATVIGSVASLNDFLTQLQAVQPRAVLITALTETVADRSTRNSELTQLTMTFQAFVAPASAGETAQLQAAAAGR